MFFLHIKIIDSGSKGGSLLPPICLTIIPSSETSLITTLSRLLRRFQSEPLLVGSAGAPGNKTTKTAQYWLQPRNSQTNNNKVK